MRVRDSGWENIRIRDEHPKYFSEILETVFGLKILSFFDADLDKRSL
jgi:hypothetical protein